MAIRSLSCADTQQLSMTVKCARFANVRDVAIRKLTMLDAAPTLGFMRMPPCNDIRQYNDVWHVRINQQWRLTFKWGNDGPCDVKIEDSH